MRVKILRVDKYGYCGREHHPTDDDIGRCVLVLKTEAWCEDGPLADHPAPESVPQDVVYTVFECVTGGGKRVELIDHEVEVRL